MGKTGGNHGTTGNYIAVTIGILSSIPHEELVSTVLDCRVIAQSAQTRTWRPIQSNPQTLNPKPVCACVCVCVCVSERLNLFLPPLLDASSWSTLWLVCSVRDCRIKN